MARTRSQKYDYALEDDTADGRELIKGGGATTEDVSYTPGALRTSVSETTERTRTVTNEMQNAFGATKDELAAMKGFIKSDMKDNNVDDKGQNNTVGVQAKTLLKEAEVKSNMTNNTVKYGKDSKGGVVGVSFG